MWCLDKVYKEGLRLEPVLIAQYKRKDATAITKHLLSYKQNSNGICFNPKLVSQHDFAALDCIVYRKPFCQGSGIIAEICIVLTPAQITPSGRALHIQCSSSSTIRVHCSLIRSWWMFEAGERLRPGGLLLISSQLCDTFVRLLT